jgi:hypothetical protein
MLIICRGGVNEKPNHSYILTEWLCVNGPVLSSSTISFNQVMEEHFRQQNIDACLDKFERNIEKSTSSCNYITLLKNFVLR